MSKKTILLSLPIIIILAYFAGPSPKSPNLDDIPKFSLEDNLLLLQKQIAAAEAEEKNLKPNNEAKIIFHDSIPTKTAYSIVYLHGFSASHEEGAPVHTNLAKKYKANLYLARWEEHGIDAGDTTMANLTADKMIASAEKALAVGKKIGDKVIFVATSAGGALALHLASKHPEIEALVLYSPCIAIYDKASTLLDNPWGLKIAQNVKGGRFNDIKPKNETQPKFWTMHYRLEALVALQNFLTESMTSSTFEKVKCPVYLAYYYEDEEHQDKVVSVPAMLEMFEQLGSAIKEKEAFPTTKNHVIASYVLSDDWEIVQKGTEQFLDKIIKL